jgi:hypothetical protein
VSGDPKPDAEGEAEVQYDDDEVWLAQRLEVRGER